MGQILQGCAKTTAATRRAIQNSEESIRTLAERYSITPKIVMKWKHRESVKDLPMGPKEPSSTVLSKAVEAMIVTFRKHTLRSMIACMPCRM